MRCFTVRVETDVEDPVPVLTDHARRLTEELAVDGDGTIRVDVVEDEGGEDTLIEAWHSEIEPRPSWAEDDSHWEDQTP